MRGSGEILAEPDKIRDRSWQMRSYTVALLKTKYLLQLALRMYLPTSLDLPLQSFKEGLTPFNFARVAHNTLIILDLNVTLAVMRLSPDSTFNGSEAMEIESTL